MLSGHRKGAVRHQLGDKVYTLNQNTLIVPEYHPANDADLYTQFKPLYSLHFSANTFLLFRTPALSSFKYYFLETLQIL